MLVRLKIKATSLSFDEVKKIMLLLEPVTERAVLEEYDKTRPVQKKGGLEVEHGRKDRVYHTKAVRVYRIRSILNKYARSITTLNTTV
jgi:hypothetical protein